METVRFYERKQLIAQPRRPVSGRRQYGVEITDRIRFIRRAQGLGFSLAEVRQLLELRLDPRRSCSEVKAEAESKIASIDARITSLRRMRKSLLSLVRSCSGEGPVSSCPILDVIDSNERTRR